MTREDPVSRAWETFYQDAVAALTRQARNDPLRAVITKHRPLIDAALAASPAARADSVRATLKRIRRAYERGATADDLVMLVDAALAASPADGAGLPRWTAGVWTEERDRSPADGAGVDGLAEYERWLLAHGHVSDLDMLDRFRRAGVDDPRAFTLHPGQHEFRTTCRLCGEGGMLHVSVITNHERVTISDPRFAASPADGAGTRRLHRRHMDTVDHYHVRPAPLPEETPE